MARPLGWGIIGCGDVVEKKSGPSILQAGGSRIVGVMRRDAEKARPFAEANGIALCTDDAKVIINHPDIQIVYVATPPAAHKQYVLAAAAAGKHVLVEKPMGLSAADDREMIEACDAAGVELFVAYYRRFHPHVLKIRELIEAGRIGRPVTAQITYAQPPAPGTSWGGGWRVQPEVSGGGLFVDVVSHRIDLMVCLLGEPSEVRGLTTRFDAASRVEQAASLSVRFANGTLCSISGDFASRQWADRFVIAGTEGVIESPRLDGHTFSLRVGEAVEEFQFAPLPVPHLGLIQHIERVLAGQEANASSGGHGLLTDSILDAGLGRHSLRAFVNYQSPADDPHLVDEEAQWGRLLSRGDPRRGMALVYVQKFCTAVHEFEPAFRAGVLDEAALEHVRGRLVSRLDYALKVIMANGLNGTAGLGELRAIREALVAAPSLADVVSLTDRIHDANHVVCEALEG